MTVFLRIVAALVAAAALAAAGFFVLGPERVWEQVAGPADQGPVDFRSLRRRSTANDSLACSPGACAARADITLPFYSGSPPEVMAGLDSALGKEPDVTRVDDGSDPAYRRYVARSRIMRFPDTIDARAIETPEGTALMLYSRSLLGRGDMGVNRGRLADWTGRLAP